MNDTTNNDLPRISIRGLSKSFGDNVVLDGVDLDIMPDKSTTVIGMSGTGKSVLIKCILGLLKPDAGEILVDGENWLTLSENEHLKRMRRIGMLFQGAALFDSLKVWENVSFALLRQDVSKKEAKERAIEVLALVGLHDIAELMPAELSGGMAKRVGLARTICHKPDIVFFDEPTTGLDPIMSDVINHLILRLHKNSGTTMLSITHDLKSAEMISDHIALLCHGRIHRIVPANELRSDKDPMLRQFVEGRAQGPFNCSHWGINIEEAIDR
ncbi:MAG: ABC transporter ATP-binding protein [Zetaproteobacteria bacterium CG12_big_fil_rev_8_21_14_0_65_55_1124]|nr:MAG: ABC transporter ATP-binding protein [Zetaproteobacteria bacterium CG1_02_55_237]PIS19167.1 MAG: ABC transporter ATP-binding protein [Zetaproteobacteria bacterium CG08_land_8_20_14_0_20_55_17]PIW43862.1 MAG: ABC transporter ATP-binding protein [Zetaproteobacteria bacterium CG12_big_fil_rev_8_21_14_0_65_55_1124]PIY53008.1 MAG: ABC transporter ATP-binding protein [Zetaproteobacteria bacterium CG_4_10_14_0_8_um_filter_55_43]PIZ37642.1 MAG: ABC transporter ATP-binding protein [Zetaproteobact